MEKKDDDSLKDKLRLNPSWKSNKKKRNAGQCIFFIASLNSPKKGHLRHAR